MHHLALVRLTLHLHQAEVGDQCPGNLLHGRCYELYFLNYTNVNILMYQ